MGFFGKLIKSAVQVVATPITIVADVIDPTDEPMERTGKLLDKAKSNLEKGIDELSDGEII